MESLLNSFTCFNNVLTILLPFLCTSFTTFRTQCSKSFFALLVQPYLQVRFLRELVWLLEIRTNLIQDP